jgi:hypothetical protein
MFRSLFSVFSKKKLKNTFKEYGHYIDSFCIKGYGNLEFAQWEHPFAQPLVMSEGNINFYKQLIEPGDFVIDIGAHIGDTTVPMAIAAGKQGTVLALEPNKYYSGLYGCYC